MKPVTQMLRAYIEPDKFAYSPNPDRKLSQREQQEATMEDIKAMLGPEAWPWFGPELIFDTETTTDIGQKLRFGVFQLRGMNYRQLVEEVKSARKAKTTVSRAIMDKLQKTGLFYNLETCTSSEISTMQAYAATHDMAFMTVEEFIKDVFYKTYYLKWGKNGKEPESLPCMVIGHNLPFDLGALSVRAGPSRGDNYGGLTLTLMEKRPGVTIKKIGFGKHMYGVHQSYNKRRNHKFVDTMQLSQALFGASSPKHLQGVLDNLEIQDVSKSKANLHGPITEEVIDYCVNDVQATWRAYDGLRALYCKHGVSTPIDKIYSEASIGKAYLKDFGVKPFVEKNPNFDRKMIGPFMEALYGGRSEVRWRHEIREGMQADFKSQYPTVNALMKLQELNIAERVVAVEEDWRGSQARMLKDITLEMLQLKEAWPLLRGVALVEPHNDILPVRTVYEQDDPSTSSGRVPDIDHATRMMAQQIGLNVVVSGPNTWYSFADVIVSKLLTRRCPKIIRTITLKPVGVQEGLKEFKFFGDPEYTIDLTKVDLFQRLIDMRSDIKRRLDFKGSVSLSAMEQGIKLTSNGTAYGVLIEFIVEELKKITGTMVYHGSDVTRKVAHAPVLAEDGGIGISGYKVERPGKWFAPWGPLIPAGGRLLLAIAERLASDQGIPHGFCDTDSMFFVKPDGMEREEFQAKVGEIAGPEGWFQALNPYSGNDALFNIEDANYRIERGPDGGFARDDKGNIKLDKSSFEPLYLFAVSAKRYVLANCSPDGEWIIRKASGHGLGHVTAPNYDKTALPPHPAAPLKDDGSPDEGKICRGSNPKLFCDLWRIVLEAASKCTDLSLMEDHVFDSVVQAVDKLPGLDESQFIQQALATRDIWLCYNNLPHKRAFMFFNILSSPKSTDVTFRSEDAELKKRRDDLLSTSFYAPGVMDFQLMSLEEYRAKGQGNEGLYRRDNNQFPVEMLDPAKYRLKFRTVADCLYNHFTHGEYKSRSQYGLLHRKHIVVLEHEYIGKETSSVLENAETDDPNIIIDPEQLPNIPLFKRKLNMPLLEGVDLERLSKCIGVTKETIRKQLLAGHRLNAKAMERLQASIELDEDGGVTLTELPWPNDAQIRAARIARRLRVLHDALAKGKDFDLNAPQRRSALKNVKRGPVPLSEIEAAIVRQLSPEEKGYRVTIQRLHSQLPRLWEGYQNIDDECMRRIEKAIALASGAERAASAKAKRNAPQPNEERAKQLGNARARRFAPFMPLEHQLAVADGPVFGDELIELVWREWIGRYGVDFVLTHRREALSALRLTMAHTTLDNAALEAQAFFEERLAKKEVRKEQGRLRVRKLRSHLATDKADRPIDGGIEDTPRNGSLGDDDT